MRTLQSVVAGGRVLQGLAAAGRPMMLREIAEAAELTAAQAHGYLLSFRDMGAVIHDPATSRYALGPFARRLGLAQLFSDALIEGISARLKGFAERLELGATLSVWSGLGPIVVRAYDAPRPLFTNLRPGALYSLRTTATGRLFAAYLDEALWKPLSDREPGDPASAGHEASQFRAALQDIRRQGVSVTVGWPAANISAISAPMFDEAGRLRCAVTLIGATDRLDVSAASQQREALAAFIRQGG